MALVLVGDGSDRKRLERYTADRGARHVTFVDSVPLAEMAGLWAGADFGFASLRALPIFEGTRPSKIFPIMASGKPVLYSGAGEAARLIEKAEAGLVVPPENAIALANAFEKLIDDPRLARAQGENGRRYAEQHLTWDKLVGEWLQQLGSALGETEGT